MELGIQTEVEGNIVARGMIAIDANTVRSGFVNVLVIMTPLNLEICTGQMEKFLINFLKTHSHAS